MKLAISDVKDTSKIYRVHQIVHTSYIVYVYADNEGQAEEIAMLNVEDWDDYIDDVVEDCYVTPIDDDELNEIRKWENHVIARSKSENTK